MRKSIELKNQLGTMNNEYRQVLEDPASKVDGRMTADAKAKLQRMDAAMDALTDEIAMHERAEARASAGGNEDSNRAGNRAGDRSRSQANAGASESGSIRATDDYHNAFSAAMLSGRIAAGVGADIRNALQADLDDQGGVLVVSEQFANRFIQAMDAEVFMRGLANVSSVTTAAGLGIPTLQSDVDDADWTAEIATGNEDQGLKFGKRELKPHPLAKRVKISKKLLRLSSMAEAKVIERLRVKFGYAMENGYLNGSGVNQPLGVFTPSNNGIDVSRDVITGSAAGLTSDSLFDAKYSLKAQYHPTATWILHRNAVRAVRKMKNNMGDYIWQPGLTAGAPARILDSPYVMSEFAPSTLANGTYAAVIGDFKRGYEIVDALDMTIQVLTELYAETNQNGYIARLETDGMPVLAEAFARLKVSAN